MLKYLNYEQGFFIECGAYDGIYQSNTFLYEKNLNWGGVLIESSKNRFIECESNRLNSKVYNYCLTTPEKSESIIYGDFNGGLMSSVGGIRTNSNDLIPVETKTLTQILDEYNSMYEIKNIDFFSLDVEGYEYEVLLGLDLKKWRPNFILIEIMDINKENIFNYLNNNGYDFIENLTNFNKIDNPNWDGTHNDYLFKSKN